MATICPNIPALIQDSRFQNIREVYKGKGWSDFVLACYLNSYRTAEDLDMDWYPESEEDFYGFTDYLNRPIDNEKSPKLKKEDLDQLYKTMTSLYSTPQMLEQRLNLISRWFSSRVDRLASESPMLTRAQVIRNHAKGDRNGFQSIMDEVFAMVKDLSTLDGQKKVFTRQRPNASDVQWESEKDFWQYRADEFKKMYDNKDFLAALVAPKISSSEGIAVGFDGLTFDVADIETVSESGEVVENEDNSADNGEAQKGDRYVDFRELSLMSTLSVEARTLIGKLQKRDSSGNLLHDDLGYTVPLDVKQTAITLHRVLRLSEPETMMNDLRAAAVRYPDLGSLVSYLEQNPDDRGLIYSTFKKARSNYYYAYRSRRGRLDVHSSGSTADGYDLSREAGSNLSTGAVSGETDAVVNADGSLKDNDVFTKLYDDKTFYQLVDEIDWHDYDSNNDHIVEKLASRLRGVGFQVTADNLKSVFSGYPAGYLINGDTAAGQTPAKYLVQSLKNIYDRGTGVIKMGDDVTGNHLYSYAQDLYSNIAEVLSPLQRGESEERIISGSKSLSVNINPNALHQMMDVLSNEKNLSATDYKAELMSEFGQYEGMGLGFGNNVRLTGWLADAVGDTDYKWKPQSFRLIDMTDSDKKDYASLTSVQHLNTSYAMYVRGAKNKSDLIADNGHMYEVPIQSDYGTAYNFVFAPGYTLDELIERLTQEVECEVQRIAAIKERLANDPSDKNAELTRARVLTYEKRGTHFQIFPEMNNQEFLDRLAAASPADAHGIILDEVRKQLETIRVSEHKRLSDAGMFTPKNLELLGIKSEDDASVNAWILNSFYARQQITKLLYGGLENFKGISDFEKRNMYAHATRIPLYTKATYKGEKVGKKNQRVLYLSDDISKSAIYDQIVKIAERLKDEKKITPEQAARMKDAYEEITTTDGQGIRTLDSMRSVKIMASLWTDADEQAYKNIKSGNYTQSDVEHFMVGLKPIYTGYETIPAQSGQYQKPIRVPVLHKYSEMVLLPEMEAGISLQNDSVPFQALNKINEKLGKGNEIDLFLFGSGVKIGSHSLVDAFAKDNDGRILKDAESIADFTVGKINGGNFWVHTLPFKYYGIAASVHADVEDKKIAWASQAEKEAWANILPGEKISVNGQEMDAAYARELYNKIKAARTVDTFENLKNLFYSDHKLAAILKEELASKPYQSRELSFLLQIIDGEGSWSTPLYQPSIQHDAVALLSSILRKRLTKVPVKGANILQTSGFGMDMDASGFDTTTALKDEDKLEVKFDKDGNFKYVEAYIPIHDSRLEQFADEWGNISPTRLDQLIKDKIIPESVLHFIAYRTPSDAEHSVIPCRIKGFVANVAGATIRLPKEIMPMTGHDYDGDKLRCHFKDFTIGWNEDKIHRDFEKFSDTEVVKAILSENDDPTITPYEVFRRNAKSETNPDSGKYKIVKDIAFDYSKTPLQNIGQNSDYRALNNALVDLMFGQLTSPAGHMKMFIPGGNAETTMYARTMQIIRGAATPECRRTVSEYLKSNGLSGDRVSHILRNTVNLYNYLVDQNDSVLSDLVARIEGNISPFTVSHATESHAYMMDGAGMIGVYAVYNSAAAMFQRIDLNYIPTQDKEGNPISVGFFGKRFGKLFDVISNGSYSTLGMARLVNAAVDNGKSPVLGHLNQTAELAPITNFLFAAGLSEEEVHLILNQPALIELGRRMKEPGAPGFLESSQQVLSDLVTKQPKDEKYYREASVREVSLMPKEKFIENLGKTYQDILNGSNDERKNQIRILQTLQHIYGAASDLDMFTKLTRPESNSGSIDSSLGGTVAKIIQLDDFREKIASGDVQISGMDNVIAYRQIYPNSMTKKMLTDSIGDELPEVVALNTLLKDSAPRLFREKFPQTKESWMRVAKRIAHQYTYQRIPGSVVERIQSDMLLWKLLSNSNFITDNPQVEQKRILEEVPAQLRELKGRILEASSNPGSDALADRLANNLFLSNLELGSSLNAENEKIYRIRFKLNGPSVEGMADQIRAGWDQLWREEETRQLAEDLLKYNLYTNGFSYGRYEFYHYAPFSVFYGMKGFREALVAIRNDGWTDTEEEQFFHQYSMNHWGDKNFIFKITTDELPMNIRATIGYDAPSKNSMSNAKFNLATADMSYIVVPMKVNNRDTEKLYRLQRNETGSVIGLEEAQKLGIRNGNSQVMVQYNPKVRDYHEVRPTFTGNEVSWESKRSLPTGSVAEVSEAERMAAIDDIEFAIPIPTGKTVRELQEKTEQAAESNNGKLSFVQHIDTSVSPELQEAAALYRDSKRAWNDNGYKFNFAFNPSSKLASGLSSVLGHEITSIHITGDTVRHIKKHHSTDEALRGQRDLTVEDIAVIPYLMNNYDTIQLDPSHSDLFGRAVKLTKRINGVSVIGTIERGRSKEYVITEWEIVKSNVPMQNTTPGPNVQDGFDLTKVQNDIDSIKSYVSSQPENDGKLSAEQAASLGFEDEYFSLVERDKDGNPVIKSHKGTPDVVRQAREQKVYAELNKRLRELLQEQGISVGALEEAEARLGAAGVSDFSTAKVFVEGLKELIRIANGIEGEYALPEEFAHVAIEMLGHDHPLVRRLLDALNSNDAALEEAYDGMLDEYKQRYGEDNREKLVVEAAGKLVAKQLFLHQETKTPSIKNLIRRICDAIKNFFKRFSLRKVENAVFDAEGVASQLARDLLSGRLADEMSLEKITAKDKFLKVDKDLSDKKDILSKLLQRTTKRADVLSRRVKYSLGKGASSRSLEETKNQLAKLEKAVQEGKLEVAIVDYLTDAMSFMKEMEQSLDNTINNRPMNSVCKKLQIVKDTMSSFANVYQDVYDALSSGEIKDEVNLKSTLRDMRDQIEDFWTKYHNISKEYFKKFLSNVYGEEGVTVSVGRDKGRKITLEEMATKADRDISYLSRWLHAASDIDDYVLQAMDRVTRDAKMEARDRVRQLRPRLEAVMAALIKEQGNRDQTWMFEYKTVDGKKVRTGRYISAEQADKLSDARKNFYKVFMELKHEADLCVPEVMVSDRKMIMFRKEHYEKMKQAQGLSGKTEEVWENAKNSLLEMGDVDYENEQVITDFSDNKVDQLPLKFLNKGKNESYDDMTEDAATSLMAYLGMAFEYKEMNNVIGILENARYMASLRDVGQRRGFKRLIEKVGNEEDYHYTKPFTVKQAKTNLQDAINDFYQMHVYGHLRKDEGTIGKTRISTRKAVDLTNRITSLSQMAINLHQRIANVNTGFTQILVESAGGKIKAKDVAWATGIWTKESADRLAETGKTDYNNKLSLWMDYFDIHQDNGRDAQLTKYGRSDSSRVFNEGLLYSGLSIGEDFLAGTTALSLAHTYKLKGPDGKDANLWDAYEVKFVDPVNKTGGYLVRKEGYIKADGSEFTKEDERKFQREVIGTNFELQGIYNTDDRSAIQQNSLGALAIMYRKWIAPAFKRRYGRTQFSNLKDDYQEGYYITSARMIGDTVKDWFAPVSEEEANKIIIQILTDFRALKDSIVLNWGKLNEYERGNVKKAMTELGVVICLVAASAALLKLPPDDHDGNKFLAWTDDIIVTQLLRLRSEIGSQAPTPMLANEALRIASSPFAALRPIKDSLNIFQLAWAPNYVEKIKSGRYAGKTKAHKYFMSLPIISMFRKFDNFIDPSPLINYYKNQNY